MDGRPLTGRDAAEAIGLCMRLGAADARVDGRAVLRSLRTREGRGRVFAALTLSLRVSRPPAARRDRRGTRGAARRTRPRVASATGSPGRPAPPDEPEAA